MLQPTSPGRDRNEAARLIIIREWNSWPLKCLPFLQPLLEFVSQAVVTECSGYNCFGQTSRKRLAKSKGVSGGETLGGLPDSLPPLAAPRRPPGNISWTFSSSSLSIKWDPVVPLRNESAVTGYKVRKGSTRH